VEPSKTIEQHFVDWEADAFGFSYGTGEPHILAALKTFLALTPFGQSYQFEMLEQVLTPTVAWLMINALCKCDIVEYGSSPRYGWLTEGGKQLRAFVGQRTVEELVTLVTSIDNGNYVHCGRGRKECQCGGFDYGQRMCPNPFWRCWRDSLVSTPLEGLERAREPIVRALQPGAPDADGPTWHRRGGKLYALPAPEPLLRPQDVQYPANPPKETT
jgi:hypothetical protein